LISPEENPVLILGIDPGSRFTGYGIIERVRRTDRLIEFGVIRLKDSDDHSIRLKTLFDRIGELIETHRPDECALEMPIYAHDAQAMLKIGRAQAAAMLAALTRQIPVTQYAPKEVKKSVTGNGSAAKEQVAYMVRSLLSLPEDGVRMTLDASDALAVALCHAQRCGSPGTMRHKNWDAYITANPGRIARGR
jgi:crossover junction endodeoxyribonuclease RuvC